MCRETLKEAKRVLNIIAHPETADPEERKQLEQIEKETRERLNQYLKTIKTGDEAREYLEQLDLQWTITKAFMDTGEVVSVDTTTYTYQADISFTVVIKGEHYNLAAVERMLDIEYDLMGQFPDEYLDFDYIFSGAIMR